LRDEYNDPELALDHDDISTELKELEELQTV